MRFLYDFGISQDDPGIEKMALNLEGTNLLCIASGGEVPLSLLSHADVKIKALDISESQIRLCRLKLASILSLEPREAAGFLGFYKGTFDERTKLYARIRKNLSQDDSDYWSQNTAAFYKGPIFSSRFEKYIMWFTMLVRLTLGSKRLKHLMDIATTEERQRYFDDHLQNKAIKALFNIAFSARIYKNRGLNEQGLTHQEGDQLAGFFYSRFRDFFTATPPFNNYYFQIYFFGELLSDAALPDYLKPANMALIRLRKNNIDFCLKSVLEEIAEAPRLLYRNYSLSNISDWISTEEMDGLLNGIMEKSIVPARLLLRYIHKNPLAGKQYLSELSVDNRFEHLTHFVDRFPFYSISKLDV